MKVCLQHHDDEADLQNLTCCKQNLFFELSYSLISNTCTEMTEYEFIHRYDSSNSSKVHDIQFCINKRLHNSKSSFLINLLCPLLNPSLLIFRGHRESARLCMWGIDTILPRNIYKKIEAMINNSLMNADILQNFHVPVAMYPLCKREREVFMGGGGIDCLVISWSMLFNFK